MHTRQQQLSAILLAVIHQVFNHVDTCGVNAGNRTHTNDENLGLYSNAVQSFLELVYSAEEQGTSQFVNHNTLGNLTGKFIASGFFIVSLESSSNSFHFSHIRHTLDEQHCSQQDTHFDSNSQVDDHGQEESHQHDDHVALGKLEHLDHSAVAAHIESHLEEHSSKSCHRNHFGILAQHQHDEEQHNSVNKTGNRGNCTVTDIGSSTGNSASSRNTAKHGRKKVSHTLTEKFGIGAMLGRSHTVGNHCRKQGFNGTENSDSQSRLEHFTHHGQANVREVRSGETGRNVILHTDGHNAVTIHGIVPAKNLHDDGSNDNSNEGARNLSGNLGPQNADSQSDNTNDDGVDVDGIEGRGIKLDLADSVCRVLSQELQAKEVGNLTQGDNHGDTCSKAHSHRIRNELDDGAELCKAKDNQDDTGQESCGSQAIVTILAHDAIDDHDEGASGAANLEARTTQQADGKASDDGSVKTLFRTHTGSDSEGNCQRQCQDAHDYTGHQVAYEILLGITPLDGLDQFGGDSCYRFSQEFLDGFFCINVRHLASPFLKARAKFKKIPLSC